MALMPSTLTEPDTVLMVAVPAVVPLMHTSQLPAGSSTVWAVVLALKIT